MINDSQSLNLIYKKYKNTTVYHGGVFIMIICVCLLLLVQVVMPQYDAFMAMREEVVATRERIQIITNNISYLQNLDDNELETNFTIAMSALPSEKDFVGLVNAISSSSFESGILLDDFDFAVGTLATASAAQSSAQGIELELDIRGDLESTNNFIKEISQHVPLSEVFTLDVNTDGSSVKLKFYNKPVQLITYANDTPIQQLTPETIALLEKLKQWKKTDLSLDSIFAASGSSTLSDPF